MKHIDVLNEFPFTFSAEATAEVKSAIFLSKIKYSGLNSVPMVSSVFEQLD